MQNVENICVSFHFYKSLLIIKLMYFANRTTVQFLDKLIIYWFNEHNNLCVLKIGYHSYLEKGQQHLNFVQFYMCAYKSRQVAVSSKASNSIGSGVFHQEMLGVFSRTVKQFVQIRSFIL